MIIPGTTYRTKTKIQAKGTIHFNKPLTLEFNFELPADEDFKISIGKDPTDIFIQVWLLDSKKHESEIVEQEIFASPFYNSFSLTISHVVIENHCDLLTDFEKVIYFYSPKNKFGELSNFADFGFEYQTLFYPTVEHFYQSQKFVDKDYAERIRKTKTPKTAAQLGQNRVQKLKTNWDQIKNDIMFVGVLKKFETHKNLKELLLSTGNNLIIENSTSDNYWCIGMEGEGLKQLGTRPMRVKQKLKNSY